MPDENQNPNPVVPGQGPAPVDSPPNLASSNPAPSAAPPAAPVTPAVGRTADPIAADTPPPTAVGGVQMPQPAAAATSYAGFWIRVLAIFIDTVILWIVGFIITTILRLVGVAALSSNTGVGDSSATPGGLAALFGTMMLIRLLLIVLFYGYYVIMTGVYGATIGKKVLGLMVVDANGQKIGIGKAIIREVVGKIISALALDLGYLWVAFDAKKQGWHDKIANTYVVKIR